jgi:hypothetical protein
MTKAVVTNNTVGLITDTPVIMGNDEINHRIDEPVADLIAAGIYDYSPVVTDVPQGTKRDGGYMDEIDHISGTVQRVLTYVNKTQTDLNNDILRQIAEIEATITNRRIRGATLTTAGRDWLAAADASIAALRATLIQ